MDNETFNLLNTVQLNTQCTVQYIDKKNNPQIKRMYDLGIIKGAHITPVHCSMFGNTKAYLIKGSIIALRNVDAQKIIVTI